MQIYSDLGTRHLEMDLAVDNQAAPSMKLSGLNKCAVRLEHSAGVRHCASGTLV